MSKNKTVQEFEITVGDTRDPIGVQLKQRNAANVLTPVDLTLSTLKFEMVADDDTVVVAVTDTGVTILVAATGFAQFTFSDAHVATAGVYWGRFIEYKGGKSRSFPTGRLLRIRMKSLTG